MMQLTKTDIYWKNKQPEINKAEITHIAMNMKPNLFLTFTTGNKLNKDEMWKQVQNVLNILCRKNTPLVNTNGEKIRGLGSHIKHTAGGGYQPLRGSYEMAPHFHVAAEVTLGVPDWLKDEIRARNEGLERKVRNEYQFRKLLKEKNLLEEYMKDKNSEQFVSLRKEHKLVTRIKQTLLNKLFDGRVDVQLFDPLKGGIEYMLEKHDWKMPIAWSCPRCTHACKKTKGGCIHKQTHQ